MLFLSDGRGILMPIFVTDTSLGRSYDLIDSFLGPSAIRRLTNTVNVPHKVLKNVLLQYGLPHKVEAKFTLCLVTFLIPLKVCLVSGPVVYIYEVRTTICLNLRLSGLMMHVSIW